MSEHDHEGRPEGPRERSITELTVDLTVAWLRRVEGTADGRDPKEVVQAMDEFFQAIGRFKAQEQARQGEQSYPHPAGVH